MIRIYILITFNHDRINFNHGDFIKKNAASLIFQTHSGNQNHHAQDRDERVQRLWNSGELPGARAGGHHPELVTSGRRRGLPSIAHGNQVSSRFAPVYWFWLSCVLTRANCFAAGRWFWAGGPTTTTRTTDSLSGPSWPRIPGASTLPVPGPWRWVHKYTVKILRTFI